MAVRQDDLRKIFAEAIREITHRRTVPDVEVGFYPFAGLNSYIRIRKNRVYVKLSDILQDAPRQVHRALAHILVAKLFRKTAAAAEYEEVYRAYTTDPHVVQAMDRVHRARGKKRVIGPQGRHRDLEKAFHRLNHLYFNDGLKTPTLTWSARRSRTILGHTDHTHKTLVISRILDDPEVPDFVFDYVLYHEMLHLVHLPKTVNGKRYFHNTEFQQDEKRFRHYAEAQEWVKKIAGRRARHRRRR